MQSFTATAIIILAIFAIDFSMRLALARSRDAKRFKPAGLISLMALCFMQGPKRLIYKSNGLKRLALTMPMLIGLISAIYMILIYGIPERAQVLHFGLLLSPLFIAPFYHFIYELLALNPLSVDRLLNNFHTRGVLTLLISCNVIFISWQDSQTVLVLLGHCCLAFLAMLGAFFVCTTQRQKHSSYDAVLRDEADYIEPKTLRYLVSVLEFFYTLCLFYYVFIAGPLEGFIQNHTGFLLTSMTLMLLLLLTTIIVKIKFYQSSPISLEFYEQRALPLSFLLFGMVRVFYYYF